MRTAGRHLVELVGSTVLVVAIWLLWDGRPTNASFSRASSGHGSGELLTLIAWLGALLLAVGLLYRFISRRQNRSQPLRPTLRHLHQTPRPKPLLTAAYSHNAFPLILKRPQAPAEHPITERRLEPAPALPDPDVESSPQRTRTGPTISLLGPLTISSGRKQLRGLRGPTKELLAYLALHPAGAHRDQIIDALWSDQPSDQGRNRLWRAAGDARSHFGEAIIHRDGDYYRLERTEITIDLDRLDELTAKLERLEHSEERLAVLERALALFTGEPLAGSDFPWAENEQRRLHALKVDLLGRAGIARLELGDPTGALGDAEAGLALEPYNEKLVRLAMEAESTLGLRGAVMARYEQLRQLLEEQLGLEPHRETRQLFRTLLGQDKPPTDRPLTRVPT